MEESRGWDTVPDLSVFPPTVISTGGPQRGPEWRDLAANLACHPLRPGTIDPDLTFLSQRHVRKCSYVKCAARFLDSAALRSK